MAYKNPQDPRAKEARRKHYQNNKEQYYQNNRRKKLEMRSFLVGCKDVPCKDCGVKYPSYVMDFDHKDMNEKTASINTMISRGSWDNLKKEVEKCEVVCANCHRVRTYKRRNGGIV